MLPSRTVERYSVPSGRATTSRCASSITSGRSTPAGRTTADGLPSSLKRRTSTASLSAWLTTNSMQRSISSSRSRVLGMRIRSRASSTRRFFRISLLPLVAVIAPFDGKLAPRAREEAAADRVTFSQAENLPLGDLAVFAYVEVERNNAFFGAGAEEFARAAHVIEDLRAVERAAELNVPHVPSPAGKKTAREHRRIGRARDTRVDLANDRLGLPLAAHDEEVDARRAAVALRVQPRAGDARLAEEVFFQPGNFRGIRGRRLIALVHALVGEDLLGPVEKKYRIVVHEHLHARRAEALDAAAVLVDPALHHARPLEEEIFRRVGLLETGDRHLHHAVAGGTDLRLYDGFLVAHRAQALETRWHCRRARRHDRVKDRQLPLALMQMQQIFIVAVLAAGERAHGLFLERLRETDERGVGHVAVDPGGGMLLEFGDHRIGGRAGVGFGREILIALMVEDFEGRQRELQVAGEIIEQVRLGRRLEEDFIRAAMEQRIQNRDDAPAVGLCAGDAAHELGRLGVVLVENGAQVAEKKDAPVPERRQFSADDLNDGSH